MTTSITARANDKYIGETGAILNGSKVVTSFVQSGAYWIATGQTQQEPPMQATNGGWPVCVSTALACIYPERVFLDGKDLWQVASLAALGPGMFYFDYVNHYIYLVDNPTGHTVESVMTQPVVTVRADAPIEEVVATMERHQIRRVPVVDDGGCCAGIIAQADIAVEAPPQKAAELVRELSRDPGRESR